MSTNRSIRGALRRSELLRNKTNQGRELVNNPQLYQDVVYKMGKFLQCIHISVRYNAIFGTGHLNDGIMEAAVRNSNVGACANAGKLTRGKAVPSDEWFAIKLKSAYQDTIQSGVERQVLHQLDILKQYGRMPKKAHHSN